jgi:hypothetical protein
LNVIRLRIQIIQPRQIPIIHRLTPHNPHNSIKSNQIQIQIPTYKSIVRIQRSLTMKIHSRPRHRREFRRGRQSRPMIDSIIPRMREKRRPHGPFFSAPIRARAAVAGPMVLDIVAAACHVVHDRVGVDPDACFAACARHVQQVLETAAMTILEMLKGPVMKGFCGTLTVANGVCNSRVGRPNTTDSNSHCPTTLRSSTI